VFVDGVKVATLEGERIVPAFIDILNDYVARHFGKTS
jgi:(E)-4-hydroxy-3-methylbut-2-enyl-diphosphate synthase